MFLSIKKKDSVTSILLFIFNVFLVERGITAVPLKKIFKILEPFQKSETSIRMGLSRGVQNGLLLSEKRGNEVYYLVTNEAARGVDYWRKTLTEFRAKIPLQLSQWDEEWSMLHIDSRSSLGDFFQSVKQLGFGSLSNNLWISPYDLIGKTEELAQSQKVEKYFLFRGKLAGKTLPEDVINNVWPIKGLAEKYFEFMKMLNDSIEKLDMDSFNGGGGLPFLHIHGLEFFEIIQEDPQLPLKLLPSDWPGLKAARAFLDIREQILPKANNFMIKVLSE